MLSLTSHFLMLFALSYLFLFTCTGTSMDASSENRKELRNKEAKQEASTQMHQSLFFNRVDPSRVIQLSWRPRVFLYRQFLSDEECDSLISLGQGRLPNGKSTHNNGIPETILTDSVELESSETPSDMKDDIAARIEERISDWTFLPKENGTPLQILHYGLEDERRRHTFSGSNSPPVSSSGAPLMATVVLYLSNVTLGGEILFPDSEFKTSHSGINIWSDCTESEYALRPTRGNALLFFSAHPNASLDRRSSHERCPVLEGDMWCALKLFYVKAVDEGKLLSETDAEKCSDEVEMCPQWASAGECQRNPVYMVGTPDYYGACRKSCNAC